MRISRLNESSEIDENVNYDRTHILFRNTDYLGLKKSLSLTYDQDMKIEVFKGELAVEGNVSDQELMATFDISGISSLKDNHVGKKEGSTKPKVSLNFEYTRSGLVNLAKAEAKMEELVTYNETIKKPKVEETTESTTPESTEEKTEEPATTPEGETSEDSTTEENKPTEGEDSPKETEKKEEEEEVEIVTKTKMKPHTFSLGKINR